MKTLLTLALALLACAGNAIAEEPPPGKAHDWLDKLAVATARESYSQGRLDDAEKKLRALAKNAPLSVEGLILAGDILRERGDWVRAEAAFRAAIAAAPGRANLHLRLGRALYQQQKITAADAEFAKYVELRGTQP